MIDWSQMNTAGNNIAAAGSQVGQQLANFNPMKVAQDASLNSQQIQSNNLKMGLDKLNATNQILSSVAINPTPQSYQAAKGQLSKLGVDTSSLPATWGPEAQEAVKNSSIQSGQALEYMKARVSMEQAGVDMTSKAATANAESARQGLPTPYSPNSLPGQSTTLNTNNLFSNMAVQPGQTPGNGPAAPGGQPAPQAGGAPVANGNTPLSPAANLARQQAQAKAWIEYKKGQQATTQTSQDVLSNIDEFNAAYDKTKLTGGLLGGEETARFSGAAQEADKAANRLAMNLIPSMHTRVTQKEFQILQHSTLSRELNPSAVGPLTDQLKASAEGAMEKNNFIQALDAKGITDPQMAESLWGNYVNDNPIVNPDGSVNRKNISNWQPYTTDKAIANVQNGQPAQPDLHAKSWVTQANQSNVPSDLMALGQKAGYNTSDIAAAVQQKGLQATQAFLLKKAAEKLPQ